MHSNVVYEMRNDRCRGAAIVRPLASTDLGQAYYHHIHTLTAAVHVSWDRSIDRGAMICRADAR
jgi:hypothetical protein